MGDDRRLNAETQRERGACRGSAPNRSLENGNCATNDRNLVCQFELHSIELPPRMDAELSEHVQQEMARRGIPLSVVESVLTAPAQKVPEHGDVVCYQSKVEINQKPYLVRVMVNEKATPPKVVTAYRTSKINKYWKLTT